MKKYTLSISLKTKALNLIRLIFKIPTLEKCLVSLNSKYNSLLIQKLIPPNYLYSKDSIRSLSRNGINYKLDIGNVIDHFIYFGFKDKTYDTLKNDIVNAKCILDVGANIANTSLFFASICQAQIYSFEPNPGTYKKAIENIELNKFHNIRLMNFALGHQKESLKLYQVNERNSGMNRILKAGDDYPFQNIRVDTLDAFVEENNMQGIDLIKIDVEGFEWQVLKGGERSLKKFQPILVIEIDENNLKENDKTAFQLIEFLQSLGYKSFIHAQNSQFIDLSSDFSNCHFDMIARA